jgi:NTE family protein
VSTAFVCSGGGAKAAAHLGAAQVLAEQEIVPMHYVGTSLGAVIAVLLAAGGQPRLLLEQLVRVGRSGLKPHPLALFAGLRLPGLLRPAPLRKALETVLPVRRFTELRTPCTITAVDLDTGALVRFGAGGEDLPLVDALMASSALPLFLPEFRIDGRRLADGGLRAVVPLDEALLRAPTQVIAVQVGPRFDEVPVPAPPMPAAIRAHSDATGILMAAFAEQQLALWHATPGRPPLLYVRPRTERQATFKVPEMPRFFTDGETAMRAALAAQPAFARR